MVKYSILWYSLSHQSLEMLRGKEYFAHAPVSDEAIRLTCYIGKSQCTIVSIPRPRFILESPCIGSPEMLPTFRGEGGG
ncbi:hypothetical protein ACHAXH_009558 [Discostella pseudostelligera]